MGDEGSTGIVPCFCGGCTGSRTFSFVFTAVCALLKVSASALWCDCLLPMIFEFKKKFKIDQYGSPILTSVGHGTTFWS